MRGCDITLSGIVRAAVFAAAFSYAVLPLRTRMDDKIDRVDGDEAAKVWWERLQKRGFTGIKDHAEIRTYLPHIERFFAHVFIRGRFNK